MLIFSDNFRFFRTRYIVSLHFIPFIKEADSLMRQKSIIRHLLVVVLYFLIALIIVGHNPMVLLEKFIGTDTGDTYEMARNIWYFSYAIQNGEPLFYQTMLGYPDGIDGIIFIALPLQYFPMTFLALFLPLQIAYNFVVLFWLALNGWSMYWLARYLLNNEFHIPSLIAGLVYMAFPAFQAHLAEGHAGLIIAWSAPLYLWALFRYTSVETNRWRWLAACILFFYLSTTGHILQSIYVLMPLTGTFLLAKLYQRDWQASRRIIGMGLLASILLGLIFAPAILSATGESAYAGTGGFVRYSADMLAVVSPSFFNPTFDSILSYPRQVLGTNWAEGTAYIGVLVAILSVIGLIKEKKSRWYLLLGGIAWLFSLGPVLKIFDTPVQIFGTTIQLPFALLQNLPAFNLARTPARFNFTLAIAVAVMAAYGANWLWRIRRDKWKYAITVLIAIGIIWEYQVFLPQPLLESDIPQAILDLREDESIRAVFNIPYQHALSAKDALYLQTGHEQPLIAGQITRTTPVNPAKLAILQTTLEPFLLNEAGADIVILHRSRAAEIGELDILEARANSQLGAPIYSDEQIAIYRVPDEIAPTNAALSYEIAVQNIVFEDGINLSRTWSGIWDERYYFWLEWQLDNPRTANDVRFVHIVDENGEIVLQEDIALGIFEANEQWAELIAFDMSDLASGDYLVRVGWYNLSNDVLTNYLREEGQGAVIIGSFTRP
jgi:hypothetical protein